MTALTVTVFGKLLGSAVHLTIDPEYVYHNLRYAPHLRP
jgi:hypothetical protein